MAAGLMIPSAVLFPTQTGIFLGGNFCTRIVGIKYMLETSFEEVIPKKK